MANSLNTCLKGLERLLVQDNKQLIAHMEQKIKETIAQVWGEEKAEGKAYETNEGEHGGGGVRL